MTGHRNALSCRECVGWPIGGNKFVGPAGLANIVAHSPCIRNSKRQLRFWGCPQRKARNDRTVFRRWGRTG